MFSSFNLEEWIGGVIAAFFSFGIVLAFGMLMVLGVRKIWGTGEEPHEEPAGSTATAIHETTRKAA